MMVTVDRNIVDGKVVGAVNNMWFRSNGIVDAGSRFEGMPEKMELSAPNYIKAFNIGVEASKKNKKYDAVKPQPVEDDSEDEIEIDVAALKKELSAAIKEGTVSKVAYMSELEARGYKKITEATPEQVLKIRNALLS